MANPTFTSIGKTVSRRRTADRIALNDSAEGRNIVGDLVVTLRFLTPFAFLALVPLGGWLGGAWTFIAAGATPLFLASLDAALGVDRAPPDLSALTIPRWVPRLYLILQLTVNVWAAAWVSKPTTTLMEAVGLAVSSGITTGVFGFIAAHEMIHSPDRRERALGLALLGSVL